MWNTQRIGLITALIAAVLAYPVAAVLVHGNALTSRILTLVIIVPLAVSMVMRACGWQPLSFAAGDHVLVQWSRESNHVISG